MYIYFINCDITVARSNHNISKTGKRRNHVIGNQVMKMGKS